MGVTAIVGGQWGSEGKGVVAAAMASRFDAAVRVGGPNAGHSFKHERQLGPGCSDGLHKHVMRGIPCAWINEDCSLIIGPGAVVDPELLQREARELSLDVHLDYKAVVVQHGAGDLERKAGLVSRIGSTAEGVGIARRQRLDRNADDIVTAADVDWPDRFFLTDTVNMLDRMLVDDDASIMLEGTQGSGLSLIHGDWPYVTSADTNVAGMLSDAGLPPTQLEHTVLVCRTYPIRVGGNSGPMGDEIDWSMIPSEPDPERTTVTNRVRRIARWNSPVVRRAVQLNDPCGIVLTFTDYLDPSVAGDSYYNRVMLSGGVRLFVEKVERETDVPVIALGTGGPAWSLAVGQRCNHDTELFPDELVRATA